MVNVICITLWNIVYVIFLCQGNFFSILKNQKIKSYIWYHCRKVKLAHYKSRTDFLKVLFTCQSFIKSVAWWLPIGIKLELKVSKSQNHFFLETTVPKKWTKYLTKFCPSFIGQNFDQHIVCFLGNGVSRKNGFEIYWPLIVAELQVQIH